MKLIIGSEHGAVDLKEEVKRVLKEEFADLQTNPEKLQSISFSIYSKHRTYFRIR